SKHFGVVLDYLSGDARSLERMSGEDLEAVKDHFDYFAIPFPKKDGLKTHGETSPLKQYWDVGSYAQFGLDFDGRMVTRDAGEVPGAFVTSHISNPESFKVK